MTALTRALTMVLALACSVGCQARHLSVEDVVGTWTSASGAILEISANGDASVKNLRLVDVSPLTTAPPGFIYSGTAVISRRSNAPSNETIFDLTLASVPSVEHEPGKYGLEIHAVRNRDKVLLFFPVEDSDPRSRYELTRR